MKEQIYVIEETVATQVWTYKGEVVSEETIFHICDSTWIRDGRLSHFPDVEVKIVEQQILTSVSKYCYTGFSRAKFVEEENGFVRFTRESDGWGYTWKFPVKRRVGNLAVLDKTAGEYRNLYYEAPGIEPPWKPVSPSNPLKGFEGVGLTPRW